MPEVGPLELLLIVAVVFVFLIVVKAIVRR
jgi:hypothetical protein